MKKRFNFHCWKCKKDYTFPCEITEERKFIVYCPYCEAKGVVDLRPLTKRALSIQKGENTTAFWEEFDFPEVMQTTADEQEETTED